MASISEEPMAGSCFCPSISSRTSQIPCLHLTKGRVRKTQGAAGSGAVSGTGLSSVLVDMAG